MAEFDPMSPESRRGYLGASDVVIIMCASPWKSPFQLWEEKMGLYEDSSDNEHIRRGRDFEPVARHKFESLVDGVFEPCFMKDPKVDWMACNLDGWDMATKTLVEIKCPSPRIFEEIKSTQTIPLMYQYQMTWQAHITKAQKCYFFAYEVESKDYVLLEFKEAEGVFDSIFDEAEYFWSCVESGLPPEGAERNYPQIDDDLLISNVERLQSLQDQAKVIDKEIKYLKNDIVLGAGEGNARIGPYVLEKTYRRGSIDFKKIPQIQEMDLEKYRKEPIIIWRIR